VWVEAECGLEMNESILSEVPLARLCAQVVFGEGSGGGGDIWSLRMLEAGAMYELCAARRRGFRWRRAVNVKVTILRYWQQTRRLG
jgi:hypothetical protein